MVNVQMQPNWGINTPSKAPIGGAEPAVYAFWRGAPLGPAQAMLGVEGPSWATVEAYFSTPAVDSDDVQLSFDATFDGGSLADLMLFETDLKRVHLAADGTTIVDNHSVQRRFDKSNLLELSDPAGGWTASGITAPAFQPGVPLHHVFYYARDAARRTYGTELAEIGGLLLPVHPEFQALAPQASTWPAIKVDLVQFQLTIKELPAAQSVGRGYVLIENVALVAQ